jgi:serine protease Do
MMRMLRTKTICWLAAVCLVIQSNPLEALAQGRSGRTPRLAEDQHKSGTSVLRAFSPVAGMVRSSVIELRVGGDMVAFGVIIDPDGLAITKLSEIREGTLTATLSDGRQLDAELIGRDDDNDVGLVRINARELQPIEWAAEDSVVGQWGVTPGIDRLPEAVGIISVPPRRILHKRALIGVALNLGAPVATIREIMPGLGAEKAGLQVDDVIQFVEEQSVSTNEELMKALREFRDGQTVRLRGLRGSEAFDMTVLMMIPPPGENERPPRHERMNRMGGELSQRAEGFALALQHDTVLLPWQCGSPLVNLEGKAIGLNIARAGRVASYALPSGLVEQIIANLKRDALTVSHQEQEH